MISTLHNISLKGSTEVFVLKRSDTLICFYEKKKHPAFPFKDIRLSYCNYHTVKAKKGFVREMLKLETSLFNFEFGLRKVSLAFLNIC